MEDLECDSGNVEFDYRDDSVITDACQETWERLFIFSCDLEDDGEDGEILEL